MVSHRSTRNLQACLVSVRTRGPKQDFDKVHLLKSILYSVVPAYIRLASGQEPCRSGPGTDTNQICGTAVGDHTE